MTVLVLGSSHVNSLMLARKLGRSLFDEELHFLHASIEAWRISPLEVVNNNFQFRKDPLALLCSHENVSKTQADDNGVIWVTKKGSEAPVRVPNNIRQLEGVPIRDAGDISVIVLIGVFPNPVSDSYFENYDFCSNQASPERQLLSDEALLAIEHPVTGNYASQRVRNSVTEYLGPPALGNQLEGKKLLQELADHYPGARKYLVGFQPALAPLKMEVAEDQKVELIRRRINFNSLWNCMCSTYGWEFVTPPVQAMDENQLFIRRKFSIDPDKDDPHLNSEYGELLWNKLFEIDSTRRNLKLENSNYELST